MWCFRGIFGYISMFLFLLSAFFLFLSSQVLEPLVVHGMQRGVGGFLALWTSRQRCLCSRLCAIRKNARLFTVGHAA